MFRLIEAFFFFFFCEAIHTWERKILPGRDACLTVFADRVATWCWPMLVDWKIVDAKLIPFTRTCLVSLRDLLGRCGRIIVMNLCLNIVPELTRVRHALTNRRKASERATRTQTVFYIPNNMYAHSNKAFAPSTAITRMFTQKYSYRLTNCAAVMFS